MKTRTFLAACAAVVFVLCFTMTAAGAETLPIKNKVADVSIGSSGIHWQPKVSYGKISLTVACADGSVYQKTFESGVSPYFSLSDLEDRPADGSYTYELRVSPFAEKRVRKPMAEAKDKKPTYPETLVQSGYFLVRGGSIATTGNRSESPAQPLDIVHNDDVIIDGSLCVGNDCYSGLAFGFDTIVLMENNLRIFFDDTSTIQNYPRNDWRIIINDSADGGGKYFAVEDATDVSNIFVLEAGAPSNSLYVDSHGDVGINTSTPYYELHIVDGDSPCVRLDQDGSYGWTPQKWDLCGNESNFFVRDATHASKLPFRIEPDSPTDSIFIKATTGDVGMGTGSPGYALEVERTGANCAIVAERTSGAKNYMNATDSWGNFGTISDHDMRLVTNGSTKVMIETDGDVAIGGGGSVNPAYKLTVYNDAGTAYGYSDGGAWATGSSREFKENIEDIDAGEALAAFEKLNPVRFNYKGIQDDEHLGFIAEDVPEIVAMKNRDAIAAMDIVTLLTKVVQQQQKTLEEQQEQNREQQKTIAELKEKVSELEKK